MILAGHTRQIDAGKVNDRYFINNSAIAMEPTVTMESWKIQRISGEIALSGGPAQGARPPERLADGRPWDGNHYQGPAYLLSVCNSERTGGFTMAPGAEIDDGVMDLVIARKCPS